MKREKTKSTPKSSSLKKIVPKVASAVLIILIVSFLLVSLLSFFKNLDYFRIKEIVVRGQDNQDFLYLKGKNIFDIDLAKEGEFISRNYPDYKKVLLVRVLPDRILVDFIRRVPLAYVNRGKLFFIDDDSVFFIPPAGAEPGTLPLITGLERKIPRPQAGSRYNLGELKLALEIIRQMRANKILRNCGMSKVEAQSADSAAFIILDGLEVRVSDDDLKDKMELLASLLSQSKDLVNIAYIDLRFKEPVIKLKEENAPNH